MLNSDCLVEKLSIKTVVIVCSLISVSPSKPKFLNLDGPFVNKFNFPLSLPNELIEYYRYFFFVLLDVMMRGGWFLTTLFQQCQILWIRTIIIFINRSFLRSWFGYFSCLLLSFIFTQWFVSKPHLIRQVLFFFFIDNDKIVLFCLNAVRFFFFFIHLILMA